MSEWKRFLPIAARASQLLGSDSSDFEDVLQQAYLAVLEKLKEHPELEISYPVSWFLTLIRHRVVDAIRNRKARVRLSGSTSIEDLDETSIRRDRNLASLQDDGFAESATPDEDFIAETLLKRFSRQQREILILTYQKGLTLQVVARQLNRSVSSASALLYRARKRAKGILDRWS